MSRTFVSRSPVLWKLIYTTYIRPLVEFAIQAWSPYLKQDIKTLENVQRRITKIPHNLRHLSYENRCKALELTSLERRRIRGDLIQYYKFFHGIDQINWHANPVYLPARANRRSKRVRELVRNCNERFTFFNNRVVYCWNSLDDETVYSVSVNSFKAKIDKLPQFTP
mgnify:CR=1 FL=1